VTEETTTLGSYLGAARRKRRVSIERAAEETRIRREHLMRMEADEFDFLAPAYVRGFLRNYARFLKVNPEPLLSEFDRRYGGSRVDTHLILAVNGPPQSAAARRASQGSRRSTPSSRSGTRGDKRRGGSWAYAAVFAFVILAALSVVGLLSDRQQAANQAPSSPSTAEAPTEEGAQQAGAAPDGAAALEDGTEERRKNNRPSREALALSEGINVEIVASKAECWVLVESDGVAGQGQILAVGQRASFSAEKDMVILLGYASGVELAVNGKRVPPPWAPGATVYTLDLPEDVRALI